MIPSLSAFSALLTSQGSPFKSLQGVVIVKHNNEPKIVRTSLYAEAEVELDGERHLLCLPLSGTIATSTERLCVALNRIRCNALVEYRLLNGEITLTASNGCTAPCDLILQRIPEGEPLDVAVTHIATQQLLNALAKLEAELLEVGFLHRNLKPSNLIFGDDGCLYPIRYHYAELGAPSEKVAAEMASIRRFIESNPTVAEIGSEEWSAKYESTLPYDQIWPMQDMMRLVRKGELYGYLDDCDREVISPRYIYAENFFENRAVVQNPDGRMGAIDHSGRWVIEPQYEMLGFAGGLFEGRLGTQWYKIDYQGKLIK